MDDGDADEDGKPIGDAQSWRFGGYSTSTLASPLLWKSPVQWQTSLAQLALADWCSPVQSQSQYEYLSGSTAVRVLACTSTGTGHGHGPSAGGSMGPRSSEHNTN